MKYCDKCGMPNDDNNSFCTNCRNGSFTAEPPVGVNNTSAPMPATIARTGGSNIYGMQSQKPKPPLKMADLFALLGFTAALMGIFSAALILHPVAAVSSMFGFKRDTRFKGLAIAGFVISIVGGVIFILISLYRAGLIPEWIIDGTFR